MYALASIRMGTASQADPELSLTEWVVLAVVAEAPTHGFAVAKQLAPGTDLGRIITVHRPLVYRALARLAAADLVAAGDPEPGSGGPNRVTQHVTPTGGAALDRWLDRPVDHIRDLRIEFLLKLRLNQRRRRSVTELVQAQQGRLSDTFARLDATDGDDLVVMWRRHSAAAARSFLSSLAATR